MNGSTDNGESRPPGESAADVVLIVDDDEINRVVAKAMLAKQGRRTAIARNGLEAVEMALGVRFAAILMDCEMPELDGYGATRRIRAAESSERVPIIAMTAHSGPQSRGRCLAAGMDDYLIKPVNPEQLNAVIETWLGHPTRSAEVGERSGDGDLLDRATLSQLRDVLTGEMREDLIATFAQSLPRCLAGIESALDGGDEVELRHMARLLKSSAATLGALRLSRACEELDRAGTDGSLPLDREQLESLKLVASDSLAALRSNLT